MDLMTAMARWATRLSEVLKPVGRRSRLLRAFADSLYVVSEKAG
jgi:hypothetical protein